MTARRRWTPPFAACSPDAAWRSGIGLQEREHRADAAIVAAAGRGNETSPLLGAILVQADRPARVARRLAALVRRRSGGRCTPTLTRELVGERVVVADAFVERGQRCP
jgi:hypothetical protein